MGTPQSDRAVFDFWKKAEGQPTEKEIKNCGCDKDFYERGRAF